MNKANKKLAIDKLTPLLNDLALRSLFVVLVHYFVKIVFLIQLFLLIQFYMNRP